jgi:site-specific recombinase XerD
MPVKTIPSLPKLLYAFFHEWLTEQRNASHRTVLAYRDAWRLFLCFAAERQKIKVASLGLDNLNRAEVAAFLQHIEKTRRASIVTRNCRLAALRSFFGFVAAQEPLAALQCAEVLQVPFKKAPKRAIRYLESAEVAAILSQPNRTKAEGQRDHALLSLLYNSGARIQEALDLRPQDLHLKSPAHVRLMGKGQKERIAPLWPETAELLTALLRRTPRLPEETLFMNRYGEPLTASGFRFRLRQYVKGAIKKVPSLSEKRVTPHLFRHTTAVHLVAAGVDVTVIRSWLGHADLETTNHYAQANLETKRKALEQADPKLRPSKPPRWKRDADVLSWLDSL